VSNAVELGPMPPTAPPAPPTVAGTIPTTGTPSLDFDVRFHPRNGSAMIPVPVLCCAEKLTSTDTMLDELETNMDKKPSILYKHG